MGLPRKVKILEVVANTVPHVKAVNLRARENYTLTCRSRADMQSKEDRVSLLYRLFFLRWYQELARACIIRFTSSNHTVICADVKDPCFQILRGCATSVFFDFFGAFVGQIKDKIVGPNSFFK